MIKDDWRQDKTIIDIAKTKNNVFTSTAQFPGRKILNSASERAGR